MDNYIDYFENKFNIINYNFDQVNYVELLQYFIILQEKKLLDSKYLQQKF